MSEEKLLVEGQILQIKPKMGIIPELTTQNYEGLARQIREAITNSLDAESENIYLDVQSAGKYTDLIIADDGIGMEDEVFIEQFLALGGSEKFDRDNQIGRIGIGFLACAPFCKEIEIQSRAKGSNRAFSAVLYTENYYKEALRYESLELFNAGKVIKVYEDADKAGLSKHFTRIILKKVSLQVEEQLNNKEMLLELKRELERILPLPYPTDSKLFNEISPELKSIILEMSNPWKVNVFLNGKPLTRRVYGQLPKEKFKDVFELKKEKADLEEAKVSGYLIENFSVLDKIEWRGLISRYQNTTVEKEGFLGYEKKRAALQYITGELFIEGLNKITAISLNRNEFNQGDPGFKAIKDLIHQKLEFFTSAVYRRSRTSSKIRKEIKKRQAIKKKLINISKSISEPKVKKLVIKKLVKEPIIKKEATEITNTSLIEVFSDVKGVEVKVVKKVPRYGHRKEQFAIEWKGESGSEPIILLEEKLVKEAGEPIDIRGIKYSVYFIENEEDLSPCKIDNKKNEVLFNLKHPVLKNRDEKIISVLFLLTYYYDITKTKKEYRDKIIQSLSGLED